MPGLSKTRSGGPSGLTSDFKTTSLAMVTRHHHQACVKVRRIEKTMVYFDFGSRTSMIPASIAWPPAVWWQWIAITFWPVLRVAAASELMGTSS